MSKDCQCQKCTWEPPKQIGEYIAPNGTQDVGAHLVRTLQAEQAHLRKAIENLDNKIKQIQGEMIRMQGEQS